MVHIDKLYVSPVKSLALTELSSAYLDKPGIAGDRAFYVVDANGSLATQRECGPLVQIHASYDVSNETLELAFPDGSCISGTPETGEAISTLFFGPNPVDGHVVAGDWGRALSEFAGRELRLVKGAVAGRGFDGFPLSMCSRASLAKFAAAAGEAADDGRRFRQNIYLDGSSPHQEDTWIGTEVRVGRALLRVKMADPRCVVTTLSPQTGQHQLDSLKVIGRYRTDQPKEVNFGVYCTVAEPGEAAVGDDVLPVR